MTVRLPWSRLRPQIFREWAQGEHVHISGRTGQGKTYLMRDLMNRRSHIIVFGTKFKDKEYDAILRSGFTRVTDTSIPRHTNRVLVWPKTPAGTTLRGRVEHQKKIIGGVLDKTFDQGWTYNFEELHWLCAELGLTEEVKAAHHAGRSQGITCIDGMQRAMNVPVIVHGSATHSFMFRQTEESDLKRMSGLGGMSAHALRDMNDELGSHEFVYLHDRHEPTISKVGT